MKILRFPGEVDWYGVDLEDNTLCRKRDGEKLKTVARFTDGVEAARFADMLDRLADPEPVILVRRNRWYQGWGMG